MRYWQQVARSLQHRVSLVATPVVRHRQHCDPAECGGQHTTADTHLQGDYHAQVCLPTKYKAVSCHYDTCFFLDGQLLFDAIPLESAF